VDLVAEVARSLTRRPIISAVVYIALAGAQTTPARFITFNNFLQSVKNAQARDFLTRTASKIKDAAAFEEMRQYILSLYQGVTVKHSYVLDSQTFDCVPIEQQPSLRTLGSNKLASPRLAAPKGPQAPLGVATDRFGNSLGCKERTVPIRRMTLEQLSNFRTLQDFFHKAPESVHP